MRDERLENSNTKHPLNDTWKSSCPSSELKWYAMHFELIVAASEITYIQIRRRILVPLTHSSRHRLSCFYPWTKRSHQQTPSPVHWPSNWNSFYSVHRRWWWPLERWQRKYDSTPNPSFVLFSFVREPFLLRQSITIYSLGVCGCVRFTLFTRWFACSSALASLGIYIPASGKCSRQWINLSYTRTKSEAKK